jgi:segregation and condensation protein A
MMANADDWVVEPVISTSDRLQAESLIVDVDGFEGPLDLLLMLSRTQKVDLRRVSVLQLAQQYLAFVEQARALRIELAADYLVMAAWLAYLKSRLLLPPAPGEVGPSAEDLAAQLAFQLERLAAMRDVAARLMGRNQLGRDFFARGIPEDVTKRAYVSYDASLLDLMRAYARIRTKDEFRPYAFDRVNIFTMEQALERLRGMLGFAGNWADLNSFLPPGWNNNAARRRSATASHFAAVLEMAKAGHVVLKQSDAFAPLLVRQTVARADPQGDPK